MVLVPEFEKFFSGYGAYHHNPINKIIHIFCIPLILISGVQMLQYCTFRINTPVVEITFPLLFVLVLSFVYIQVDLISGVQILYQTLKIISTSLYLGSTFIGSQVYHNLKTEEALNSHFYLMLGIHLFSWILQFIGHGVFESFNIKYNSIERAPALMDNLLQIFVAPDFVIIELLFLLGYNPIMKEKCDRRISDLISTYRKSNPRKNI